MTTLPASLKGSVSRDSELAEDPGWLFDLVMSFRIDASLADAGSGAAG